MAMTRTIRFTKGVGRILLLAGMVFILAPFYFTVQFLAVISDRPLNAKGRV